MPTEIAHEPASQRQPMGLNEGTEKLSGILSRGNEEAPPEDTPEATAETDVEEAPQEAAETETEETPEREAPETETEEKTEVKAKGKESLKTSQRKKLPLRLN